MVLGMELRSEGEHMSEATSISKPTLDVWHSRDLEQGGDLIAEVTSIMIQTTRLICGVEGYRG